MKDNKLMWIIGIIALILVISAIPTNWEVSYKKAIKSAGITETEITYDYVILDDTLLKYADTIKKSSSTAKQATQKVLDFVHTNIKYKSNITDDACLISTPGNIYTSKTGQCDTMSILTIAMLRKMGIASRPVRGCLTEVKTCINIFGSKSTVLQKGLHAWAEVWLPDGGWTRIEPTSGEIGGNSCLNYTIEKYPKDRIDICLTKNTEFANWCLKQ